MAAGDSELNLIPAVLPEEAAARAASEQLGSGLFVQATENAGNYANTLYQPRPGFQSGTPGGRQETPISQQDRQIYGPSGSNLPGSAPGQGPYMPTNAPVAGPDIPRYPTAKAPVPQTYPAIDTSPRIPTAAAPVESQPKSDGGLGFGTLIDWAALGGSAYYTYTHKLPAIIKAKSEAMSPETEAKLAKSMTGYQNSLAEYLKALDKRYEPQSQAFETMAKKMGADVEVLLKDNDKFSAFKSELGPADQASADVWRSYQTERATLHKYYSEGLPEGVNKFDFAMKPLRPSIPIASVEGISGANPWAFTPRSLESMSAANMNKTADIFSKDLLKAGEEQGSIASKLRNGALIRAGALGVGDFLIDTKFDSSPGMLTAAADAGWAYGLISSVGSVGRFRSTPFLVGSALLTHYILRSADK